MKKPVKIFIKILKGIGWAITGLLVLFVLLIILIRLPAVQNMLTQKAITFVEDKIGTPVSLEHIYISFPKTIVLQGLKAEDQAADTLLYLGELTIDTDLWGLTKKQINLNKVTLENVTANVSRKANDSTFNFDYIIQAFAGEETEEPTESAWEFAIGKIELEDIRATYFDHYGGTHATVNLGEASLSLSDSDITNNIFDLGKVELLNTTATLMLQQSTMPTSADTENSASTTPLSLNFEELHLAQVNFDFDDQTSGNKIIARVGELQVDANELDLNAQIIDLSKIELSKSFIAYHASEETIEPSESSPDTTSFRWNIRVAELALSDNGIQYENFNSPPTKKGIDLNHFWVYSLGADIHDIVIKENNYQAQVDKISFREKKGFTLNDFHVNAVMNESKIDVSKFLLQTNHSSIVFDANANFNNGNANRDTTLTAEIKDTHIALRDIEYFLPTLLDSVPITFPADFTLHLASKLKGSMKNLTIDRLFASALDSTSLEINGNVKNLNDINNAYLDLHLSRLYTTKKDIQTIVTDTLLPQSLELPNWIEISGTMNGLTKQSAVEAELASDIGSILAKGNYDLTNVAQYDFNIAVSDFQAGRLMKQEALGVVELEASVKGTGTTPENLNANFDALINTFEYQGYSYQDLKIKGTFKEYFFSGTASLKDENLDFALDAQLDYTDSVPDYKLVLDLNTIDLNALHLSNRQLRAKATLEVNLETADFRSMNGNVGIRNVAVFDGEKLYKVDSLIFASLDQEGKSELSIESDIIAGSFKGTFNVVDLPKTVKQHIHRYFELKDSTIGNLTTPQQFQFDLTLKNTEMLTEILVPELKSFVPGKITGEFDSEKALLNLHIDISKTEYGSLGIEALSFDINSDAKAMDFQFQLQAATFDTLRIDEMRWNGKLANNLLETNLLILDSLQEEKYVFAGEATSLPEGLRIHLLQERLLLNYEQWNIPSDNSIVLGKESFSTNNFTLSKNQQTFGVYTNQEHSVLQLKFGGFQLSTFTNFVAGVIPASGVVNGDIRITTSRAGEFSSDLTIKDFSLLEEKWGDVKLTQNFSEQTHAITLSVSGQKTSLVANGDIKTSPELSYNFQVNLSPLDLSILEPISAGQLKNLSGTAKGKLQLKNNGPSPSITGTLTFVNTNFVATYLNNSFQLNEETISFSESGIRFTNFTIQDSKKNEASIKGEILTKNYSDFNFNLQLAAKNFRVLNTTSEDNELFYGKVLVDINANVKGTNEEPRIEMNAAIKDESDFTYVVPEATKNVAERQGIIKFVDRDVHKDPFLASLADTDTVKTEFTGLNLTVNLDLDDNARLNIVLDPRTSDMLSVYGTASLVVDMDPSGRLDLSGRYQISKGTYNFSFQNLAKREFAIEKGSSLVWSGDPLNAVLDIQAKYEVETSPVDLMMVTDPDQLNRYKQRLPFQVYLILKGRILEPDIRFRLDMPEDKQSAFQGSVYARLQDINSRESDLNKQVFALLILKRFISENPFESQASSSFSNTARQSVSRVLSDQLNRLSENIKGVELNFDIKSYENYSGEEVQGETKAQLGISKDLFNERLIVKLSGNVNVEGEDNKQTEVTDYIGDIALEYKLTSDGRLRITGFRTSDFDMIDGELLETGIGLIYIKDYNTLRELFKRNKKK